ncbi:Methyl-accepting chemotaxis protein I (serine chemoreceptor protein) [plant metagenome]|uniref:Methyl-accepting chemotaxis protein I (Serine chemoreceptor protein) n=1 Tax=plant metagenome TaxID=1297885 RepID=A0A484UE62_9ZZZZ
MLSLQNLSLKKKLTGLVLFFIATLLALGAIAMRELWSVSQQQRAMYTDTVQPLRVVVDAAREGATHYRRLYKYILTPDRKERDAELRFNAQSEQAVLDTARMLQGESDPALRDASTKLADAWNRYKASVDTVQAMADRGDPAVMDEMHNTAAGLHIAVRTVLLDAAKRQEALARLDTDASAASVEHTFWLLTGLMLLGALVSSIFGLGLVRSVMRQLGGEPAYAAQVAQEVAKGNLGLQVTLRDGDQTSVLANMDSMRANLAGIVRQVRQASEAIATGAGQISSGNTDLSQRTEEQASSLEETAASMEEMNATTQQNLDAVRAASELAISARNAAARGGDVVGNVVSTMDDIHASSQRIGDIIGVIDSIAFQTNILALNAAVEAARAGEQGRGFAVVAGEVRSLAQRSAEAAKEIKQLISQSAGKVEAGSRLVSDAGSAMNDIVAEVRRVADLISEIGAAAQEQGQGISQVSDAVNQLDRVTQENAALVEEAAAAAGSLDEQAAKLVTLVSVFQLGKGTAKGDKANAASTQAPPASPPAAAAAPAPVPAKPAPTPAAIKAAPVVARPVDKTVITPTPHRPAALRKRAPAQDAEPARATPRPASPAPSQTNDDWESF